MRPSRSILSPDVPTTATAAVREALAILQRASADWRNGNASATGPLHWTAAVPAAREKLNRALRALEEIDAQAVLRATPATSATPRASAATADERCLDSFGFELDDAHAGIAWWNSLTPTQRRNWLEAAGSAVPAEAWRAFRAGRAAP